MRWAGTDASFRGLMSVAVVGWLVNFTMLGLRVVPAVFTYIDDLEHWFQQMAGKSPPSYANTCATSHTFAPLTTPNTPQAHSFSTGPLAYLPISERLLVKRTSGQMAKGS